MKLKVTKYWFFDLDEFLLCPIIQLVIITDWFKIYCKIQFIILKLYFFEINIEII